MCHAYVICSVSHIFVCRECAVKYNNYFEFPRELDMSPYTAATLAKLEGNVPLLYIKCCVIRLLFCNPIYVGIY